MRGRVVWAKSFEHSTPCTPCWCATRLRYTATEPRVIPAVGQQELAYFLELQADVRGLERAARRHLHDLGSAGRGAGGRARLRRFGVEAMPCAVDGESLLVQEIADAANEQDF